MIKKVISGEITSGQISYMPMSEIIETKRTNKVDKSIELTSNIIYKVKNISREIETNMELYTNKHLNKALKRQVKRLYRLVKKL